MHHLTLFRTLVLRPLLAEPLRTALTLTAVALGVAVVIGIELAGNAASGSFESSLTTLTGTIDLQLSANGGLDESLIGIIAQLPLNLRATPVIETPVLTAQKVSATLYGVDSLQVAGNSNERAVANSIVVSTQLAKRLHIKKGDPLTLRLPAGPATFTVAPLVSAKDAEFLALDIAEAQRTLARYGSLDRIDITVNAGEDFAKAERLIRAAAGPGVLFDKPGTRGQENQRMLRAFRWNLRVLSYISLVVGAFLIYNTISVSVVRRRPEIGVLRAIGTSRGAIFGFFLAEALLFGVVGAVLGIALGRLMAEGLVGLISATVNSLYASSTPAAIALTWPVALSAAFTGVAVSLLSAVTPAAEAMAVVPTEAMGRGSRETVFRSHTKRNLLLSLVFAALGAWASQQTAVEGRPLFGYAAVLLFIASAAFAAPPLVRFAVAALAPLLRTIFSAVGLLAARSLVTSLRRTSVVIAALATAIAMMASVAIMVGSFRETVIVWLDTQLRADLYIRAAGPPQAGVYPPLPADVPNLLRRIPGVEAIDTFTALEIRFEGQRASLGASDPALLLHYGRQRFLPGEDRETILRSLANSNNAIVTEAFASKHHLHPGSQITISLGEKQVPLRIAGIYYDYTSERGFVLIDQATLARYLPKQPPTNLAIYLNPGMPVETVRQEVAGRTAQYAIDIAPNETLRAGAVEIFDRTFSVTYALEAIAILVAMLGAANSLLALVLERREELRLLRFLGAATPQIRGMILVEAGIMGLLADVLGLALGFALSYVLIYVINEQSFGWTIQFHPPVMLLTGALISVWIVTVLAAIYPARLASRS